LGGGSTLRYKGPCKGVGAAVISTDLVPRSAARSPRDKRIHQDALLLIVAVVRSSTRPGVRNLGAQRQCHVVGPHGGLGVAMFALHGVEHGSRTRDGGFMGTRVKATTAP
jgi:hypothetical protein